MSDDPVSWVVYGKHKKFLSRGEAAKALWDFLTGVQVAFTKPDSCEAAAAA